MPSRRGILFFCLWVFVFLSGCTADYEETALLLSVDISPMPEGLAKTPGYTDKIEICVKGPPGAVNRFASQHLSYPVDVYAELASDPAGSNYFIKPGQYTIPVLEKRIKLPPQCEITDINPGFIVLTLEEKITRRFKVTVPYMGRPASGYTVLPAEAEPSEVDITGARSQINALKEVSTKPVDVAEAEDGFKKVLPLDLDMTSGVESSADNIKVFVPVQKKIIIKTFDNILVKTVNGAGKISILPDKIKIKVKGHSNLLNTASIRNQLNIFIDLKDLDPGVYVRRAVIQLPVGLILEDAVPELFTVKIQ